MYSRTDYRLRGEFFSGIDARAYFDRIYDKIKSVLSDLGILSQDLQDLTNYFVSKYSLELITVFETNIQRDLYEIKVKKKRNPFRGHPHENDYFEVDEVRVTFTILFDGNSVFLYAPWY